MSATAQVTDDTRHSIPAKWSPLLYKLTGSPWEAEDITATGSGDLGAALAYAYSEISHAEDGVRAALKACADHWNTTLISPVQLVAMVEGYAVHYEDFDEPLQNYLDAHTDGGIKATWLNEEGRKAMEGYVCRESEVWVEYEGVSGIYVFTHPDR